MNSLTFVAVSCVKCRRSAVVIYWYVRQEGQRRSYGWCEHGAPCAHTYPNKGCTVAACPANHAGECLVTMSNRRRLEEFLAA